MKTRVLILFGLLASASSADAQSLERDVVYGKDSSQSLDLWLPAGKAFSTVLFIHGGSFTSGDKLDRDYGAVCRPFPEAGIACANVNYRLAPSHAWPAQAEDVASALAWIRADIQSRGGDPRKLFLFGHSSGAVLVALVATDERYIAKAGLKTGDIRGVVAMGSIMWDEELEKAIELRGRTRVEEGFRVDPDYRMYQGLDAYLDLWAIRHLRTNMPPFLFLIAESEQGKPPVLATNRTFVEKSRARGNRAEYKVLPGRTHYSAVRKLHEPGDEVFQLLRNFVHEFSGPSDR